MRNGGVRVSETVHVLMCFDAYELAASELLSRAESTHGDGSLCSYGFITNFLTDTVQIPVILLAAE